MNRSPAAASPVSLQEALERVVRTRTGGLIRSLKVDLSEGEVTIRGFAATYYAKQLATHAALSLGEPLTVINNIEVC